MTASLNSTEAGSQKTSKSTAITGVQGLFKVVKPLGEYLGGVLLGPLKAFEKAARIISGGLKLLGFTNAAKGVDTFTNAIKDGSAAAATCSCTR
jgi:hypothetical protein